MTEKTGLVDRLAESRAAAIREARVARGWTQARLAEEAGTSQQTVDRIERGQTRHSRALDDVMDVLGLSRIRRPEEMDGILDRALEASREFDLPQTGPIPLYAMGLDTRLPSLTSISDKPESFIDRPARLQHAPRAYAVSAFAVDEMSPAIREGDIVFVNPDAPLRMPTEVLFRSPETNAVLLRTVTFRADGGWIAEQWDPGKEEVVNQDVWPIFHPVVGKWSR